MANLYPNIDTINSFKVKPTEGEFKLINFLVDYLNDEYEIYFQPYLNGDNPDIIVVRKNGGVLIIEVKDWNLNAYQLNENMDWVLKKNPDVRIKSPLDQVNNYKDNLYSIHSEELYLKKINYPNVWSVVQCAVYFHHATNKEINDFHSNTSNSYEKKLQYINWIGRDDLNKTEFDKILNKTRINQNSSLFSDDIYFSMIRYLKHPLHVIEDGKVINYTKAQLQLSESKPVRQKIKSAAGCGKTLVLAKRAVNAHKRTNDKVLILTFNLTLVNYIRDRINEVREEFRWSNFEIINYHQFFKSQANNYNVKINNVQDFDNINFFKNVEKNIKKYKTIFIDEIQDYQQEWLDIVLEYFADEDTEIVVFGDEKQNIYERELDDSNNIKISKIPGAWNRSLNLNFRSKNEIVKLTNDFQKQFFNTKYDIIEAELQQELQFDQPLIEYYDAENINGAYDLIFEIIKAHQLHPSDCGILSSKVNEIRELDFQIRKSKKEKTTRMFETKEIYQVLKERYPNPKEFEKEIKNYRRIKKVNFWMNTGLMKLSTIQSFKGWEIDTLFLILNKNSELHKEIPELVYTGLTRARNNLFIINLMNSNFEDFFKKIKKNSEVLSIENNSKTEDITKIKVEDVAVIDLKQNEKELKFDSWNEIENLLNNSLSSELLVLNKILKNLPPKNSKEIINQIQDLGLPRIFGETSITYYDLLKNCANHLNIYGNISTVKDLEQNISQIYLKNMIDKLSPEERLELEGKLQEFSTSQGYGKELGSLAALAGAQLSGFGIYLAASTIVGGITSAIGVALPFAFYTGMSSVISTIIGPVGWIGLAGVALYKYNRVDYNKVLPPIIYLISLKYKYLNKIVD